jgi:hypothetical protein
MSLGFLQHKDSIVDLASLLEAHHKDCPIDFAATSKHSLELEKVGDSAEVAFDSDSHVIGNEIDASDRATLRDTANTEEEKEFLEADAHADILNAGRVTVTLTTNTRSTSRNTNTTAKETTPAHTYTQNDRSDLQNYGYDVYAANAYSLQVYTVKARYETNRFG